MLLWNIHWEKQHSLQEWKRQNLLKCPRWSFVTGQKLNHLYWRNISLDKIHLDFMRMLLFLVLPTKMYLLTKSKIISEMAASPWKIRIWNRFFNVSFYNTGMEKIFHQSIQTCGKYMTIFLTRFQGILTSHSLHLMIILVMKSLRNYKWELTIFRIQNSNMNYLKHKTCYMAYVTLWFLMFKWNLILIFILLLIILKVWMRLIFHKNYDYLCYPKIYIV